MKFNFEISKYLKEYKDYMVDSNKVIKFTTNLVRSLLFIFIFCILVYALNVRYIIFFDNLKLLGIVVGIAVLISLIILKVIVTRKNKKVNSEKIKDFNVVNMVEINDEFFIRENEFSMIKFPLDSVLKIIVLKELLIIQTSSYKSEICIPIKSLPVELNEFIDIFKSKNDKLVIENHKNKLKKSYIKYIVYEILIFIAAILVAFFISKYNYENKYIEYNLVMQEDLQEKGDLNSYLYESNSGVSIYFPKDWQGHYGVEEFSKERINVYYLADGKQSSKTTLLFVLEKGIGMGYDGLKAVRFAECDGVVYTVYIPESISTLKGDSEEYKEFSEMQGDLPNILIN